MVVVGTVVVVEENKKTMSDKILIDAAAKVSDFRLRATRLFGYT